MNTDFKIRDLFDRYCAGTINEEEESELAELIAAAEPAEISKLLTSAWEHNIPSPSLSAMEAAKILSNILKDSRSSLDAPAEPIPLSSGAVDQVEVPGKLAAIARQSADASGPDETLHLARTIRPGIRWWRYAAAAAAVIIISFTAYILVNDHVSKESAVVRMTQKDMPPGSQGAILTLANGTEILLEQAGEGVVSNQGGVEIVNNKGKLVYGNRENGNNEVMYNTMTTPKGRQYQLMLSDGTEVWLNAASSITYPAVFSGQHRSVSVSGEAYFEVTPDRERPFRVHIAGKGEVEVVGTHFNINAYSNEPTVNTTLLKGKVRVVSFSDNKSSDLEPGEQARIGNGLQVFGDVDTDEVMAWKNGYFLFNSTSTEAIMRQVSRWYDAEILYEGDVRNERFSGSVPRSATATKLLEVLELTRTVRFTVEDKKIIVKPY